MKKIIYSLFAVAGLSLGLSSCDVLKTEEIVNPNAPSLGAVLTNASKPQLDAVAIGCFTASRNGLATYLQVVGTAGKELFNFNSTENRWMTELNGTISLGNSAFYNGATNGHGLPVRQANILISSCNNTSAVTDQQKNGYKGVANTLKGLAYLYMLNAQYTNGVRLNVEDPFNPSKAASYDESLVGIAKYLDEGATQLDAAGSSFPFTIPTGYTGFTTPASFKKFNRAVALRVAIYQKDWAKAASLLPQTFYDPKGDLNLGPKHTFSPSSPDIANPLINTSTQRIVGVQKLFDDAEAGDKRVSNKLQILATPASFTNGIVYSTKYLQKLYTSATDAVPIIRNEELVLIAAEIAAQQNKPTEAVAALNIVRAAAGLPDYKGATTQADLINAILKERIYSLFYEGHRWVDMRRYGKLAEIVLPVSSMKIYEKMERPIDEVNWDNFVK